VILVEHRFCACGCKRSLDGMRKDAVWYSRACAVRWGRENPGKSLRDAHSANKRRTGTTAKPSGLQVSYRRAVEATVTAIWDFAAERISGNDVSIEDVAERAQRGALSDRQRELLEQREAA
jgi:hypothetical protein